LNSFKKKISGKAK